MSMQEKMPERRCGEYISAGITSYPCWLTFGHDGPHVAVEVPRSAGIRAEWQAQQDLIATRSGVNPLLKPVSDIDFSASPKPPPSLDPAAIVDGAQREAKVLSALATADPSGLPDWARQGMVGSAALTSLGVLWVLAEEQFDGGAQSVLLSKEFLERLVTPSLRAYFSALRRQEIQ